MRENNQILITLWIIEKLQTTHVFQNFYDEKFLFSKLDLFLNDRVKRFELEEILFPVYFMNEKCKFTPEISDEHVSFVDEW